MTAVAEREVTALAFCPDRGCVGYTQQPVQAVEVVTETSFLEAGGDGQIPGVYRSDVSYRFADPAEQLCPFCQVRDRTVNVDERPEYAPAVSQDAEQERAGDQTTRLLVEMAQKVATLEARPKPGRKPKDDAA